MARKWKKLLAVTLALSMTMSLLNMTVWAGAATDAANETLVAAQTALEEAKADLETKKAAQTEAQAAVDAVQAAYDEAVAAIDTTAVNAAKEALDAAKEETTAAQTAAEDAATALRNAQDILEALPDDATAEEEAAAQQAVDDAQDEKKAADSVLAEKQGAEKGAQDAFGAAEGLYNDAVAAAGESTGYTSAKDALTVADEAVTAAEAVVETAQANVDAASKKVTTAQVEDMINELPAEITEENAADAETAIRAARTGYEALTDELKELLTDEDTLVAALETAENNLAIFKAGIPEDATNVITTETADPQAVMDANDTVYILPGTYENLHLDSTGDKTLIPVGTVVMKDTTKVECGILVSQGTLTIAGAEDSLLKIEGYGIGIIVGIGRENMDDATLVIGIEDDDQYGEVEITGSDGINVGGSGAAGSGIMLRGNQLEGDPDNTQRRMTVQNATLNIHHNRCAAQSGSSHGIYRHNIDATDAGFFNSACNSVLFDNAVVYLDYNSGNGFYDESFNSGHSVLDIIDSTVTMNGNNYNGYTGANGDRHIYIEGSDITASDNGSAGMKFDCSKLDILDNSYLYAKGNGSFGYTGMTNTTVQDSTIETYDNKLVGMVFYGESNIDNSYLHSTLDGDRTYSASRTSAAAARIYPGDFNVTDSVITFDSVSGISFYNTSSGNVDVFLDDNVVAAINAKKEHKDIKTTDSELFDDWNGLGNTGRTFMLSGSLQAIRENMTLTATTPPDGLHLELNPVIPASGINTNSKDIQYTAPLNANYTALTRFDLNKELDHGTALTEENGIYKFTTIDPNLAENAAYDYTFRYNTKGEDLVEDEKDNAYVWAPVTVITYDATEGAIADAALGTAQKGNVALNSRGDGQDTIGNTPVVTTVTTTDPETGAETSEEFSDYIDATDYTICGSSMALSEAVLPAASRSGYSFSGWYYAKGAENIEKAAQLAATGKFTELYALLKSDKGAELTSDTLTAADGDDVEAITVYALWDKNSEGGGGHTDYYKVTVNYYDKETGKKIATSYVSGPLRENSRYDVTDKDAISIEGYTYDSTTGDPLKGTMDKDKVIDVWYVANEEIPDPEVPTDPGQEIPPVDPGKPTDPGQELPDPEVPTTDVPKTGDSSLLWLAAAAVSGIGLAWLAIADKKRKNF